MKTASIELRVAFSDLDGMRAVYHTNYIKWFDLARTKLFREAGFKMEEWENGGVLLPLVVCHCEYKEGAVFDDPLKVTAAVQEIKGKVITLEYEIENMNTKRVISTGLTKQVFCDENSKSFVLQEKYPELYKNLLA
ncbi:MAG: acyl-CoA thioesterase [Firmicutes bacterium]|nr:acyl-CoA thioesterase [Bacillota bacterium]